MQTIKALKEGDWIDETYLVVGKQVSISKTGSVYLSVKLADKTGEIDGKLWDNAEEVAKRFEREDFVRIKGVAASYQGSMQIKMRGLDRVDDGAVDLANFLEASPRNVDEMASDLAIACSAVGNAFLKKLLHGFLSDTTFLEAFKRAPAAKTLHHNYLGGLLEHVVELIALARDVGRHFPGVDEDLLIAGAFLHDIGKVRELSIRKSIEYTNEGRLLGHIALGYEMLVEKIKAIPGFPAELTLLLKHIMLSHHGEYEYGSPKRPKIQEAIIINYLDDLAAKVNNFQSTLKRENVKPGDWTAFSKMHERYLYRQADYSDADLVLRTETEAELHRKGKKSAPPHGEGSGNLPLDI
jgi:3'-5' exoribonuclease